MRAAAGAAEVAGALALRHAVFSGEQGVDGAADQDGRDPESLQVVALREGRVVGTCRVLIDGAEGRLGRMAVEPELRNRGIGTELLLVAEREAREQGARQMLLHAQLEAEPLYARAGYERRGGVFLEQGIEHVGMEREL